ncbi:aminotransferase class V-fold PLP-dependent enzyme [Rubellimicrobium aerolatum]|uniref:Aminotransferase class V-fold PLP-dependent enzyme n=1 Tax=Rubellimicrobium aerolatum TaxID=490979 RepID=A0ABW0S5V0_9RHOB|nr:aminotransferase class V-fold PLP-dependent enzyme [Rubellimicrobium aerolatum]MBP1804514.1 selenocysteine lyase/cysteine desulfurase [Rubellimicrobium aerolatum]
MTAFDAPWVRARFPAFAVPALRDQSFFENAGGSFPCAPVVQRLTRFYTERKVQPYAPYAASQLAGAEMDEARARLAAMLGVQTHELSFGPSTTANTYVLAQAVRKWLKPGEAIVVTNQDHEANSGPWRRLAEDGVEIREWRIDPATGHLDPEALPDLLSDGRVRLVCFPHCSNVVAEINDVARICAIARAAGARTCVDGVSYAPHGLPDVGALGCDVYLFSAYKVYGPHQGIMTIREDWGRELPNQAHFFNGDTLYKRLTPAGPDHAQIAASAGIADYLESLSAHHGGPATGAPAARFAHDLMRAREVHLLRPLLAALAGRNDLRLLGPTDPDRRAPTVALELPGPAEPVAAALAPHGIMAGGGDFYAVRPLRAMGVDPAKGVLRLSFTHYTSEEDIDRLLRALSAVLPGATR